MKFLLIVGLVCFAALSSANAGEFLNSSAGKRSVATMQFSKPQATTFFSRAAKLGEQCSLTNTCDNSYCCTPGGSPPGICCANSDKCPKSWLNPVCR